MKIWRSQIWRVQTFTDKVKSACAKTSSSCGVSASTGELQSKLFVKNFDKARIVKQIVYKKLYQHKYNLPEEEQLNRLSRLIVE